MRAFNRHVQLQMNIKNNFPLFCFSAPPASLKRKSSHSEESVSMSSEQDEGDSKLTIYINEGTTE